MRQSNIIHTNSIKICTVLEVGRFTTTFKTNPKETKNFLATPLFLTVFNFPSLQDYWYHGSNFNVEADIMPRKIFQLLHASMTISETMSIQILQKYTPYSRCLLSSIFWYDSLPSMVWMRS